MNKNQSKISSSPLWSVINNSSFSALMNAKKICVYNEIGMNKPKTLEVK